MSELVVISAMTRDRVIGRKDGLPWNLPDEYAHFVESVRGHPVIMGRTSWEIFGGDLGDAFPIIVSRSPAIDGVEVASGIEQAIERGRARGTGTVFSAGGASVYAQTVPHADVMLLSIIEEDHEGDARFPAFDEADWTLAARTPHPGWELRRYERIRGGLASFD